MSTLTKWEAVIDELRVGLTSPELPPYNADAKLAVAALWESNCSAARIQRGLEVVGIGSTLVRKNGGTMREDLVADLRGWPGATAVCSAGRGGTPLAQLAPDARVARLLSATRERRMLAHLHLHRGILYRLTTWSTELSTPATAEILWEKGTSGGDRLAQSLGMFIRDERLYCLGFCTPGLTTVAQYADSKIDLGAISTRSTDYVDTAHYVGCMLRTARRGLWRMAHPGLPASQCPDAWLAETATVRELVSWAVYGTNVHGTRDWIHGMYQRTERTDNDYRRACVHVRVVDSNGGEVLGPAGLRMFHVQPGPVACIELAGEPHDTVPVIRARLTRLLQKLPRFGDRFLRAAYLAHLHRPGVIGIVVRQLEDAPDLQPMPLFGVSTHRK